MSDWKGDWKHLSGDNLLAVDDERLTGTSEDAGGTKRKLRSKKNYSMKYDLQMYCNGWRVYDVWCADKPEKYYSGKNCLVTCIIYYILL